MSSRWIIALVACLLSPGFARAEEPVRAQTWSLGGAALAISDGSHVTLWENRDGMSAGMAPSNAGLAQSSVAGGMQTGGFLAWQTSIYRIDATLSPSIDGQVTAAMGASVGPMPGETGTRYGLRIGTAWGASERFTVNPAAGLGWVDPAAPSSNVNVSLLINHALTPNLNLIGLAEAQRNFGLSALEGNSGLGRLVVGAGLGYKF
jgi:hypothetical protein